MSLLSWFQKKLTSKPALTSGSPLVHEKPLHQQFQRIGGGLTPLDVSYILRQADGGQPARFVDLTNESRQKDGHMQGALGTRDTAVSLIPLEFIDPPEANEQEQEAAYLCRRIYDGFRNWSLLIQHLTASYLAGHATAQIKWEKQNDGLIIPVECVPIHPRDFIFAQDTGALRYARYIGDTTGIDLLGDNPGRIIQLQRRIVGDVPAREGLARVLVWAALLRNWNLRDWVALGEIGWKPWRIAKYPPGAHPKDQDDLVRTLEQIGTKGVGVISKDSEISVEWPRGFGPVSVHKELFDTLGREMSKAILGQTTSIEAGPNGDRAATQTRMSVSRDIFSSEATDVAAALRYHMFMPAVAVNIGPGVRVAVGRFQTDESADQGEFSKAVKTLRDAGLSIPAKWVRDTMQMPPPTPGDEVLALTAPNAPVDPNNTIPSEPGVQTPTQAGKKPSQKG